MTERMDTEEFAARVAAPLKASVAVSAGFDARVMRAVEEAARPWWRRRHAFTLSPLGGLALAAGFGGLMALAGVGAARALTTPSAVVAQSPSAQAPDTVHIVRFVLTDAQASQVTLVGDFNGWSREATPLVPSEVEGRWIVDVVLPAGRHEYAFLVDGERWVTDPSAVTQRDEFGQESSVVRIGDALRGV
jgi:anti-sigma factor RsiW